CPFHNEKTPSFVVSPERQLAYCFGCNKGGDMFTFVQEIEGVDFKGALEILADKAGLDMSKYKTAVSAPRFSKDDKDVFFSLNKEVAAFYTDQLLSTKDGAKVLQYLDNRGFNAETIRAFGLGLAPDSFDKTYEHLVQKNCTKDDLLSLGLVMSKDTDARNIYDRFRLRLMFPIHDGQGRMVGFGGRAIKKGDEPKYMNSPESPIYHKGQVLYGFNWAKASIREEDLAVVVEGYMDVIASHQAGVKYVVASSGTALTVDQIKLIKRLTKNVAFAFDTDRAGEEALLRAVQLGQIEGLMMSVIRVPEGKDPDECIKQDPELWKQAIIDAPNYLDYYLHLAAERFKGNSIEGKRDACAYFLPLLKNASSLERDHFIKQLAFVLKTEPSFIYDEFNQIKKSQYGDSRSSRSTKKIATQLANGYSNADYFLGLLLRFHEQIREGLLMIPENIFDDRVKDVYKLVCDQYNDRAFIDVVQLLNDLDEDLRRHCEVLMLFAEKRNGELSEEVIGEEMQIVAQSLIRSDRDQEVKELMHQIRLAQEEKNVELERELFQKYSRLFQS
ncbi:MAG: DNA primase, partial [Candidatus Peregrinibacteria bacterium]|nr:DNA primase [Candidatus Peregrinibacteria bacterium]